MAADPERGGGGADKPPAVFLMGPTASGKTGIAVELVRHLPLELISVDSALIYRGMDIGTAKPDAAILARAPHRLIDIRDPSESYSAAEFRSDALREMREITAAGRVPLLVGGTMLYFRALQFGLSRLPPASPRVRAALRREAEVSSWQAMHGELRRLDPEAAARIDPNDPQRIQRALEVIRLTGRKMSELQQGGSGEPLAYRLLKLVVAPASRAELHRRIERRFDEMVAQGFEDEVRALHARPGLHGALPAMRAVGYRQAWAFLDRSSSAEEWPRKAVAATRQLAKRQMTWLRKESDAIWYDSTADGVAQEVLHALRKFLNSRAVAPT